MTIIVLIELTLIFRPPNNQTNAGTLANTLAKTHEVNPPTNTIESEATISHPQILVEDNMTKALMAEIMKDDATDMETNVTDPITERELLDPEGDNINPNTYTNNETQNSSDSTGRSNPKNTGDNTQTSPF